LVKHAIIIHEISCNPQMMSPPRQALPPAFSPREFRGALGMFATGVTIVTARTASGELVGLTANSFNSVSLDPPLVLWSLARAAGSMPAFSTGSHYAINILAADQKDLAERFATRGGDRWAGVQFSNGAAGSPLLAGAAATFECFNRSRYEEGDHVIFVGEVEHCSHRAGASPLLFHGGKFYTEHPLQADHSAPQAPDERFVGGYIGYLLGQASHAVYRGFETAVAAHGLTHIAWRLLALLHDAQLAGEVPAGGGLPIGQLARDVLAKQPTVTKLVQRMAEEGLLELHADPADQRRTLVAPTAAGLRTARALINEARAQETQHMARWSSGEVETLKRMLKRLAAAEDKSA
jgi:flavin reductase (DIM6/NTAB) family NADH-FMN oxidoreductase RutF/DNA-binding MarR family transcriptional regulator